MSKPRTRRAFLPNPSLDFYWTAQFPVGAARRGPPGARRAVLRRGLPAALAAAGHGAGPPGAGGAGGGVGAPAPVHGVRVADHGPRARGGVARAAAARRARALRAARRARAPVARGSGALARAAARAARPAARARAAALTRHAQDTAHSFNWDRVIIPTQLLFFYTTFTICLAEATSGVLKLTYTFIRLYSTFIGTISINVEDSMKKKSLQFSRSLFK